MTDPRSVAALMTGKKFIDFCPHELGDHLRCDACTAMCARLAQQEVQVIRNQLSASRLALKKIEDNELGDNQSMQDVAKLARNIMILIEQDKDILFPVKGLNDKD